ncbi:MULTISPECIES: CARDB domain-containing protein [Thermodesulfovibrio]|jgi:hypothetical protein|uniref:CARDB domain-containing protein n=1 Tax=Thermodesulfovibrio TaxID=28261 RepID=UPI0026051CE4|nr:CARDB domain-containing protein [Thermodesulfovibrio sp.]
MLKKIFFLTIFTVFISTGSLSAEEKSLTSDKADLIVEKIVIKRVKQTPTEIFLEIAVTVKNTSSIPTKNSLTSEGKVKCPVGCFLVKVNGSYFFGDRAVLKQIYEDKCKPLSAGETASFTVGDVINRNMSKVSYTVTVDSQNWIKESNESNNEKSESLK